MKVRDRFDKNRIGDLVCDGAYKYVQNFAVEIDGKRVAVYDSLDGVVEEWEDYKPAEPLIKDEKIRKAVRAWAEANGEEDNIVFTRSCEYSDYMFYTNGGGDICFEQGIDLTTGSYTIAELCGEEEE